MKISLTCKLDSNGAYGFLKPISDLKSVSTIDVFRDNKALPCRKVIYHTSFKNKNEIIGQFSKLLKMIRIVNRDYSLSIGIYEIPHGLLAFIIGKLKRIPTVISIIGNPGYTKIRKGFRKKITYFMLHRIDAITVTGEKSKQYLINDGIPEKRIFILPNSIHVKKFKPISSIEKKYDIISLSRLSPVKELGNLLKIIYELKKSNPNIKVGIAGKGPEKERLKKMIIELSLQDNVQLLGFVNNIVEFYNSGKIFILTSSTEGLPRAVIEAMACGIPCVVSNAGDIKDIVKDGENGFVIYDYSDVEEFANKVTLLLSNKNQYKYFSKNAISYAKNNYSQHAATDVWKRIIKKIYGENYV